MEPVSVLEPKTVFLDYSINIPKWVRVQASLKAVAE